MSKLSSDIELKSQTSASSKSHYVRWDSNMFCLVFIILHPFFLVKHHLLFQSWVKLLFCEIQRPHTHYKYFIPPISGWGNFGMVAHWGHKRSPTTFLLCSPSRMLMTVMIQCRLPPGCWAQKKLVKGLYSPRILFCLISMPVFSSKPWCSCF